MWTGGNINTIKALKKYWNSPVSDIDDRLGLIDAPHRENVEECCSFAVGVSGSWWTGATLDLKMVLQLDQL